jgi:hypothetical protein
MKMKKIILYIIVIAIVLGSCSKNDNSSAAFANTTGAGGSLARYAILGNYLYTVDNNSLKVFDISVSSNPVLKSTVPIGFNIETIYPFKDKLFIGSASVVYIFSVANPEKPVQLGQAISPLVLRRCDPVVAKDTVAYATLRTSGVCGGVQSTLAVYDIKNINNPVQKNALPLFEPYGLGYSDTVLYVCDKQSGLNLFNIADAYNPIKVKAINDGSYIDVIPYNNQLICWVTDGVIIYDISDNINPVKIATIN